MIFSSRSMWLLALVAFIYVYKYGLPVKVQRGGGMGNSTKCFSCEAQMPGMGHGSKCFSCEAQMPGVPHGNKCLSCETGYSFYR